MKKILGQFFSLERRIPIWEKCIHSLLTIIIFLSIVVSCNSSNTVSMTQDEYKKLTRDTVSLVRAFSVKGETYKVHLATDGHEYYFGKYYGNDNLPIHYPSCRRCYKDMPGNFDYHKEPFTTLR